MSEYVPIKTETIKAFADEARRLGSVEDELSTNEMLNIFSGISILSNAEEAAFGTKGYEYSVTSAKSFTGRYGSTDTLGYAFIPQKDINVVGLSMITSYDGSNSLLKIWDAETQAVLASANVLTVSEQWTESILSEPVTLQAGKKYMLTVLGTRSFTNVLNIVLNDKITYEQAWWGSGDVYPTNSNGTTTPTIRLVMGSATGETEYKIQTETLDRIADEVKRITGGSDQLTTAQIITALQGIATT